MICERCGVEAPTKLVEFHYNVGLLLARITGCMEGELCKGCVHRRFWSSTAVNALLGWWGIISFFITPVFLVVNLVRYATCFDMPRVPWGAVRPVLTDEILARLGSKRSEIAEELRVGTSPKMLALRLSETCNVTPGEAMLFVLTTKSAASPQK